MRVLLVGCGGIGCEVSKLLAIGDYERVHLIDLDSVELTNLNRQFIFKSSDIGRRKAAVLANWLVTKYQERGMETLVTHSIEPVPGEFYSPKFILEFDAVINALDNIRARSTMNKLCRLAYALKGGGTDGKHCRVYACGPNVGIPLIDAGTSGIRGTCMTYFEDVHNEGDMSDVMDVEHHVCFDCYPPPPPKSLPVCTVRTFPTSAEHCVTFALNAFQRLFCGSNPSDVDGIDSSDLLDLPIVDMESQCDNKGNLSEDKALEEAVRIVNTLCCDSVNSVVQMTKDVGVFNKEPTPMHCITTDDIKSHLEQILSEKGAYKNLKDSKTLSQKIERILDSFGYLPQSSELVPFGQLPLLLVCCIYKIGLGCVGSRGLRGFTKDNVTHLLYLVSFSLLRMRSFSIRPKTPFDIVGIGANVIPAVATVNSCVAGLAVMELEKLRKKSYVNHEVFVSPSGKPLFSLKSQKASDSCPTCSNPAVVVESLGGGRDILDIETDDVVSDVVRILCDRWDIYDGPVELYDGGTLLNSKTSVRKILGTEKHSDDKEVTTETDDEESNFWNTTESSKAGETTNSNTEHSELNSLPPVCRSFSNSRTLRNSCVRLSLPLTLVIGDKAILLCLE